MKAIALANRLARDLGEKSILDLTTDVRLEVLDAINSGLQTLHARASHESKTTVGSILLDAPRPIEIGLEHGSTEVTGVSFTADQQYRTIRIDGDPIDNQIVGSSTLLHPYAGTTGTVQATVYSDAVAIPEPYDELIGCPRIIETGAELIHGKRVWLTVSKPICRPSSFYVEANARNQNPTAPSVVRFDSLPDQKYRLEAKFTFAPVRINFSDLLAPGNDIPIRLEHIEAYLLPIARGLLTFSSMWSKDSDKQAARDAANNAQAEYEARIPRYLTTPNNRVRTKPGW